jgi:CDP-diacylglycerol---serine O-phosphatidyltransferase
MLLATYHPFSQTIFFRDHLAHLKWPELMTALMIMTAMLMMSHVLYPVVPKFGFRTFKGIRNGIFILTVLVLGITVPSIFFFPALLLYLAYGVGKALVMGLFERMPDRDPMLDEEEEPGDEAGAELREIDYGELSVYPNPSTGERRRPPGGRREEDRGHE